MKTLKVQHFWRAYTVSAVVGILLWPSMGSAYYHYDDLVVALTVTGTILVGSRVRILGRRTGALLGILAMGVYLVGRALVPDDFLWSLGGRTVTVVSGAIVGFILGQAVQQTEHRTLLGILAGLFSTIVLFFLGVSFWPW